MPINLVKTGKEEKIWNKKKKEVSKSKGKPQSQFTDRDWGLVNKLFQAAKKKYQGKSLPKKYAGAFVKKVMGTGEMSQHDLDAGGEFHEARLILERLCERAGMKCKVRPFDKYAGPYAELPQHVKIWFDEGDQFAITKGTTRNGMGEHVFTGDADEVIDRLPSLTGTHLKLVKGRFLKKI